MGSIKRQETSITVEFGDELKWWPVPKKLLRRGEYRWAVSPKWGIVPYRIRRRILFGEVVNWVTANVVWVKTQLWKQYKIVDISFTGKVTFKE